MHLVSASLSLTHDATSINKLEGPRANRHTGCTHTVVAIVVFVAVASALFRLSSSSSFFHCFCHTIFFSSSVHYNIKSHRYNYSCITFNVLFSKYILYNCNNSLSYTHMFIEREKKRNKQAAGKMKFHIFVELKWTSPRAYAKCCSLYM